MTKSLFLGQEASASPIVPVLAQIAHKLSALGVVDAVLTARYGPRCVVNARGVPLESLSLRDFLEIADYDAHNDQLLVLGEREPAAHAALHALLYRAKSELAFILQAEVADPANVVGLADAPRVKRGRTILESALALLEALRDADVVVLADRHVVATGGTFDAATRNLFVSLGAPPPHFDDALEA